MNLKLVSRLVGRVLLVEAFFMLLPLAVALLYQEDPAPFLLTILLMAILGLALSAVPATRHFYAREGFFAVGLIWLVTGVMGALPFYFSGTFPSFVDCLFESVSGFTTTGATILTDIEAQPRGILFWRAFTHWMGSPLCSPPWASVLTTSPKRKPRARSFPSWSPSSPRPPRSSTGSTAP